MGANTIIAVDVGGEEDSNFTHYGDDLSGWWMLWKKWNPWATPVRVRVVQKQKLILAQNTCIQTKVLWVQALHEHDTHGV